MYDLLPSAIVSVRQGWGEVLHSGRERFNQIGQRAQPNARSYAALWV
jgi:hypothetical protein